MPLSLSFEQTSSFISLRLNKLELFIERHAISAPEGCLSVTHPVVGEVQLNAGRWAFHVVNHSKIAKAFTEARCGAPHSP